MEWLGADDIVVFLIVAAIVLAARRHAKSYEHEWHYDLGLWRGDGMRRRRPDGSWEYRAMTDAERAEHEDMMAI